MTIKVLYVVLVLCTLALMGAVAAAYLKVRRQMRASKPPEHESSASSQDDQSDKSQLQE